MSNRLALELAKHLARGSVSPEVGLPALRELLADESATSLHDLGESLSKLDLASGAALRQAILLQRCREAREAETAPAGVPPDTPRGWQAPGELHETAAALVLAVRQRGFLEATAGRGGEVPAATGRVEALVERLGAQAHPWSQLGLDAAFLAPDLAEPWAARLRFEQGEARALSVPDSVHDEQAFLDGLVELYEADPTLQARILDLLLQWPTSLAAAAIARACRATPWAQERACVLLSYRFRSQAFESWPTAVQALSRSELTPSRALRRQRVADCGPELSLVWLAQTQDPDPERIARLRVAVQRRALEAGEGALFPESSVREPALGAPTEQPPIAERITVTPSATTGGLLAAKRRREAQAAETAEVGAPALPAVGPAAGSRAPDPETPKRPRPPRPPAPPPAPAKPSVWDEHLKPLLVENWYMVVGLAMVLVGASLLAYFTWDTSPLLRYTVMPAMLLGFSLGLGEAGFRMARAKELLRGTAFLLSGAAVALIPLNFLVVNLALGDDQLPARALIAGVLGLVYVGAFSLTLRRWGGGVRDGFGVQFAAPFIALNLLSAAFPIVARAAPSHSALALAVGAYLGFGVLAWAVRAFCRDVLTAELLRERLTYLFVGVALALTFLEGLLWSHVAAETMPFGPGYALLVVLAGGLVLYVERAFLDLQAGKEELRAESFLGFALLIFGLLLAMASPPLRVLSFAAAGSIWLSQARRRQGLTHQAIGVMLLLLAGCSLALHAWFPSAGHPILGLALVGGLRALSLVARRVGNAPLAVTAGKFEPFVLATTAVVTVLTQWHFHSAPLVAGVVIVIVGVAFLTRALEDDRIDWAHASLALFALALPYLGFADMRGHALYGNSMVFGLGLLSFGWLGAAQRAGQPLLTRARSSGLCLLGVLACSAMALRVLVEGSGANDASQLRVTLDLLGPLVMSAALLVATYSSRSLVPALLAAALMAVLFPELKAELGRLLPFVEWGSGRTASICSFALVTLCFGLQRVPALRDLQGGDRIVDRFDFPLIRRDATLFTLPLGLAVAFLALKGLLWDVPRNWTSGGLPAKTAVALLIHALNWTGLTALLRAHPLARLTIHLAVVSLTAGILWGFTGQEAVRFEVPAAVWLVTLSVATLLLEALANRTPWTRQVLLQPVRRVARAGALALGLGAACAFSFGLAHPVGLALLVLAACTWHGLVTRELRYGSVAFALAVPMLFRLGFDAAGLGSHAAFAAGWRNLVLLSLTTQAAMLAIEFRRPDYSRLRGILAPFHHGTSGLALLLGAAVSVALLSGHAPDYARLWQGAFLVAIGCVARSQRSGLTAFAACCVAYLVAHGTALASLELSARLWLLATPSHLTLWTLAIGAGGCLLRPGYDARPTRFMGSFSLLGGKLFPRAELYLPTLWVALVAVLIFTIRVSDLPRVELVAPYLAAAAVAFMSADFLRKPLQGIACALLAVANTHLVYRLLILPFLQDAGLSPTHVVCLGLITTLLQGSIARRLIRHEGFERVVSVANVVLAGTVLALLAIHYVAHPNLEAISSTRFVVSGLMAYGAGLYFRQAARNPRPPFEAWGYQLEGFYHFGLSMALWCSFLLIPQLRHPGTALIALSVAPLYFYLRAEYGERVAGGALGPIATRYRDSAIVLSFFLIGLYATQGLFQLILFPDQPFHTAAYHVGAPVLLLVSLGLMRLRGLGGTDWLTFYGALGLVVGTYFGVSAIPGLSPFTRPVAAAWLALGVSHFFALATQPSPLRTFIQWISHLDDEGWDSQRTAVGAVTLAATCVMVALGIGRTDSPHAVAPLLLGLATIFAHHAWITGFLWQRNVAALITLAALHADFVLESYLVAEAVRWVLLGVWLGVILGYRQLRRFESASRLADLLASLAFLTGCHVVLFHPESDGSLILALGFLVLSLASPSERHQATEQRDVVGAGLLLLGVPWLGYFAVSDLRGGAPLYAVWPVFSVAACVVGQGWLIHRHSATWAARLAAETPRQPRMVHLVADLWSRHREAIFLGSLTLGTLLAALATVQQLGAALPPGAFGVACALWSTLAVCWYLRGRERDSLGLILLGEACALALLWLIRQQLYRTAAGWTLEFDVWASLALTSILAGVREALGDGHTQTRRAAVGTLLALPVVAIVWAQVHDLPSEVTLVVVGVNALIFSFMGRGQRNSPFNLVGVAGFVGFVLLVLYTKLEVRSAQAYVVPTGVGVLALLQLFGRELTAQARNRIEWVTLGAMVASSAYYAVFDASHPIAFNVTLIGVGLGAMVAGTLLRIRLYLALGSVGILLDLVSIAWKVVLGMGRAVQVTTLGMLLLLAGVTLVVGSAYYKSNKAEVDAAIARFLDRFEGWA